MALQLKNTPHNLALVMTSYARHIGLEVTYNAPTPGDGSCWYHSVIEQIHRRSNYHLIESNLRYTDPLLLRHAGIPVAAITFPKQNLIFYSMFYNC